MVAALIVLLAGTVPAGPSAGRERLRLDDYDEIRVVEALRLSPAGDKLLLTVRKGVWRSAPADVMIIGTLRPGESPVSLPALNGAGNLAWLGPDDVAFLKRSEGDAEIWRYSLSTRLSSVLVDADDPIVSFQPSRDGRKLAYVTQAASTSRQASLHDLLRQDGGGVLVDTETLEIYHFLDPARASPLPAPPRPSPALHVFENGKSHPVRLPGVPIRAHWSNDGTRLSVVYSDESLLPAALEAARAADEDLTSLGVYDLRRDRFTVVARADTPGGTPAYSYDGGEWAAGDSAVWVRRIRQGDTWLYPGFPDWALVNANERGLSLATSWREINARGATVTSLNRSVSLLEHVQNGRYGLFELRRSGLAPSAITQSLRGSTHSFSFSLDRGTAAFVHESLTTPPEVWISRRGRRASRVTSFNDAIAKKVRHGYAEVAWTSSDGAPGYGWLLKPEGDGPHPMVTMVHGGPRGAVTDRFAPYINNWPFPFDLLADQGVAVFYANYRGDNGYDRAHAAPTAFDAEPPEDILSGVSHLVATGVAERTRLGIAGHSHGGWLGPTVITRAKELFRAGSFAETSGNSITSYDTLSGGRNRHIHDRRTGHGSSLYDDVEPFLRQSPNLHFKGVKTALMLESGAFSMAPYMMGYAKAARHHGIPAELFVYPKERHVLTRPESIRESAERNLDWFRFWLQDIEDDSPAKAKQYERWRPMK